MGIHDAMPGRQHVLGSLGGDSHRNFPVAIDRGARRLILEAP
ncbi:MAG TPA: hypothetical protein VMT79_02735 [Candidatus Binatia bacterium]|nr:hypothetical protein [Candidatus Binatia bacterium]